AASGAGQVESERRGTPAGVLHSPGVCAAGKTVLKKARVCAIRWLHLACGPRSIMNVLFVCSANRLRSPTAEQVFSTWPGIETDSAGISSGASVLLSSEQVDWADVIFVMEKTHRSKLVRRFRSHLKGKRVVCLDIPDDYAFMDPVLVR